ncbi:MAG: D-glycerate dehydrogenase [Candidatus Uhrbacteria bacterium]
MSVIFVTRPIEESGLKLLKGKGHRVIVRKTESAPTKDELVAALREHRPDALLCLLTDKIDGEVMDAGKPNLKVIANYAVGYDNIDAAAAKTRGIRTTFTPGASTDAVAEFTVTVVLALAHKIIAGDAFMRAGKYTTWDPFLCLGFEAKRKTIGIIGLGRIGFGIAERCVKGLGLRVVYNDVQPNANFEQQYGQSFRAIEDLLRESDFVSLNVPLLPSTRHLMNEERLMLMKPTAYLINTARGPIVDERALIRALEEHWIAGAALDVHECEPALTCDPKDRARLLALPNVILTPHIASATIEARQTMSLCAAENILAALEGHEPPNPIP